jgi:hypothetical protein
MIRIDAEALSDIPQPIPMHDLSCFFLIFNQYGLLYALVDDQLTCNEIVTNLEEVSKSFMQFCHPRKLACKTLSTVMKHGSGSCPSVLNELLFPMKTGHLL